AVALEGVQADQVGMAEPGGGAELALEPIELRPVHPGEDLQRDAVAAGDVDGLLDDPPAPPPPLPGPAVVAQPTRGRGPDLAVPVRRLGPLGRAGRGRFEEDPSDEARVCRQLLDVLLDARGLADEPAPLDLVDEQVSQERLPGLIAGADEIGRD